MQVFQPRSTKPYTFNLSLESVGIIYLISCISGGKQKAAFMMQSHETSAF